MKNSQPYIIVEANKKKCLTIRVKQTNEEKNQQQMDHIEQEYSRGLSISFIYTALCDREKDLECEIDNNKKC